HHSCAWHRKRPPHQRATTDARRDLSNLMTDAGASRREMERRSSLQDVRAGAILQVKIHGRQISKVYVGGHCVTCGPCGTLGCHLGLEADSKTVALPMAEAAPKDPKYVREHTETNGICGRT